MRLDFERNGQTLRVEAEYIESSGTYGVVVQQPGCEDQREHFIDLNELRDWLIEFEWALEGEHWERQDPTPGLEDQAPTGFLM